MDGIPIGLLRVTPVFWNTSVSGLIPCVPTEHMLCALISWVWFQTLISWVWFQTPQQELPVQKRRRQG